MGAEVRLLEILASMTILLVYYVTVFLEARGVENLWESSKIIFCISEQTGAPMNKGHLLPGCILGNAGFSQRSVEE